MSRAIVIGVGLPVNAAGLIWHLFGGPWWAVFAFQFLSVLVMLGAGRVERWEDHRRQAEQERRSVSAARAR